MHNTIAFVISYIIASSVLSCVCTLPTQAIGTGLDIFSSTPAPSPTCFQAYPHPYNREIRTMKGYAVDSEGRSCFENLKELRFKKLLDKANFEKNYENQTGEFCPQWPQFKECFLDHVTSDRCSEEEKQIVVDSLNANIHLVFSDLLCNPTSAQNFRNLLKDVLNENLLGCIFGNNVRELFEECESKALDGIGRQPRFQEIGLYFNCMKPSLRKCANGDHVKEVKLIQLLDEIERAIQDRHRTFWN